MPARKMVIATITAERQDPGESGKFVWIEALQILDFTPKGCRVPANTWNLTEPENTWAGAMRKVGRILNEWWKPEPKPKLAVVETYGDVGFQEEG